LVILTHKNPRSMKHNIRPTLILSTLISVFSMSLLAQKPADYVPKPAPNAVQLATNFLKSQQNTWQLNTDDIANVLLQDHFVTDDNGLTHVTLVQRHAGIEFYNGIATITVLPSGQILHGTARFMPHLSEKINATQPSITPEDALKRALTALGWQNTEGGILKEKPTNNTYIFEKNSVLQTESTVQLKYFSKNNETVQLCWDISLDNGQEAWGVRVDALTGLILDQAERTLHCHFETPQYRIENGTEDVTECIDSELTTSTTDARLGKFESATNTAPSLAPAALSGGTYNVFPLPVENPVGNTRTRVVDAADLQASPFGWHDVNGVAGADFTITRGNNTHAYLDWRDTNSSVGDEPTGGTNLVFDYPFDPLQVPDSNRLAAVTNLFYTTNRLHDITYFYGFNEAAGNFQQKNYTNALGANDALIAQAQDGAKAATPKRNNANYTPAPDGSPSRVQMFVWSEFKEKLLHILSPANQVSDIETSFATFGSLVTTTPITGIAEVVMDSTVNPTLGCQPLRNTNLTGKIAIIDRGVCGFDAKALNAQRKGAVGVCVCYLDENISTLMGINTASLASQVTIPLVAVRRSDCARLKSLAAAGNLRLSINRQTAFTPELIDGAFDNGIVAHEFVHGVSNRLTGGRLNVDCLSDSELKGGEGWSDFIALAVTAKPSDRATTQRTIGTYAARQQPSGKGFRSLPYTTDMTANPHTYDDIILNDDFHYVGEVWTSVLWDLYWAMIDRYGFNSDLKVLTSGNGRTIKLVMDAMKIQGCNPGFLDARNAILKADTANYQGIHACMIWDVFARRGMGFNAQQGSAKLTNDNTEGFDKMPFCVKRLKIIKLATESVKAGEPITYTIAVINHKDVAVTNVVVTDTLPQGTTYIANSSNRPVSQSGSILTFNLGSLNARDTLIIQYRVNTDPNRKSLARFFEDAERSDSTAQWTLRADVPNSVQWKQTDIDRRNGLKSFFIGYPTRGYSDQSLQTRNSISIPANSVQPVLRFFHRYDTEPAQDGAIVQYSTDNVNWFDLGNRFFKNPYRGRMDFRTFGIPDQRAWYGKTDNWVSSVADLSFLKGQSARFRFRFAIDTTDARVGWFVDDIAVMDMVNYTTKARVSTAQGDLEEAELVARGTIVEPILVTSNKEITEGGDLRVFPNPTSDLLNINVLNPTSAQKTEVTIFAADGRQMWRSDESLSGVSSALLPVDVSGFAAGLYIVQLNVDGKMTLVKFVKQ
jgi:extracellular elastinolytic metalloproteinase